MPIRAMGEHVMDEGRRRWKAFCWVGMLIAVASLSAAPFAIPRSDLVVEGELALPDGTLARFISRDGTMVSVRSTEPEGGYWYGFIPVIKKESGAVNFAAYVISSLPEGGEEVKEVDPGRDILVGSGEGFSAPTAIRINVLDVKGGKFSRAAFVDVNAIHADELQKQFGSMGGGLCALDCGGVSVGANSVSMQCGTCVGEGAPFRALASQGSSKAMGRGTGSVVSAKLSP